MKLFTDLEIQNYIQTNDLRKNDYIIVDNLKSLNECSIDLSKKIFIKNLLPNNQMCNTNSKVLLSYLYRKGYDVSQFLKLFKLHDEKFLNDFFEWMPCESALKFFNDFQNFINKNPRNFEKLAKEVVIDQQNLYKFIHILTKLLNARISYENAYIYNRNFNNDQTIQFITSKRKKNKLKIIVIFKSFDNFEDYFHINHLYWFAGNLLSIPIIKGNLSFECNYTYYGYKIENLLKKDYKELNYKFKIKNDGVYIEGTKYLDKIVLKKNQYIPNYTLYTKILNFFNKIFKNKKFIRPSSYSIFSSREYKLDEYNYENGDVICYKVIKELQNQNDYILKLGEIYNLPYTRLDIEIDLDRKYKNLILNNTKNNFIKYLDNLKIENEKAKKAEAKLIELNKNLELIVQNRTKELEAAKNIIEEQINQKTTFFINLAHETKTPLTLIKTYLDKYINKYGHNYEIDIVKKNADKLIDDVVSYLNVERIEHGKYNYDNKKIINFSKLLKNQILLLQEMADKKAIVINSDIDSDILIYIDKIALNQVINNIIENAIKYTIMNDEINVKLKKLSTNECKFIVQDNGPGIPQIEKEKIFNKYYQLNNHYEILEKNEMIPGLGMGLYIVKNIVEKHNGQIKVFSEFNQGTRFEILLNLDIDSLIDIKEENYFQTNELVNISQNFCCQSSSKTILIVEDNLELLTFLKDEFIDHYNVICARNGLEAIHQFKLKKQINLIITDIMMDQMDGFELTSFVMSKNNLRNIPIIFLSAKDDFKSQIKGYNSGIIDFIPKPFNKDLLHAKVHSLLKYTELLNMLSSERKFSSIGKLVSSYNHQVKNPIGGIKGYVNNILLFLEKQTDNYQGIVEYLKSINILCDRIIGITKNFSLLSYGSDIKQKCNISNLVNSIVESCNTSQKKIKIENFIEQHIIYPININSMTNVLINLLNNSIDSIKEIGRIKVWIKIVNEKLEIYIEDNGCGINKNNLDKIFEINFTTKSPDNGSGLGLYVVNQLLDKINWGINIFSEEKIGTKIRIYDKN